MANNYKMYLHGFGSKQIKLVGTLSNEATEMLHLRFHRSCACSEVNTRGFFYEAKRPRRETDHSTLSRAKFNRICNSTLMSIHGEACGRIPSSKWKQVGS
jgi:hypothetical protein